MAQDFRNTLNRVIGTGDTTILTAGNYDAVIGIRCCNVLTTTIKVDVKILQHLIPITASKSPAANKVVSLVPIVLTNTFLKSCAIFFSYL